MRAGKCVDNLCTKGWRLAGQGGYLMAHTLGMAVSDAVREQVAVPAIGVFWEP